MGCVTAPEIVVIQGKYVNDTVLEYIQERIRPYFPKDVLPKLRINTDSSYCVQGIKRNVSGMPGKRAQNWAKQKAARCQRIKSGGGQSR